MLDKDPRARPPIAEVEAQLDLLPDELVPHFQGLAAPGHRRVLAHRAYPLAGRYAGEALDGVRVR